MKVIFVFLFILLVFLVFFFKLNKFWFYDFFRLQKSLNVTFLNIVCGFSFLFFFLLVLFLFFLYVLKLRYVFLFYLLILFFKKYRLFCFYFKPQLYEKQKFLIIVEKLIDFCFGKNSFLVRFLNRFKNWYFSYGEMFLAFVLQVDYLISSLLFFYLVSFLFIFLVLNKVPSMMNINIKDFL